MTNPIPNCPQEDKPIRERAYTPKQQGPRVVCCVCGEPCSIYSPICAKCATATFTTIENKP
ncbi:MAG TPA: hypothetical protein VN731_10320 [Rhodanobacter sp.]|nr:hypothetical protein [Rhodanobacter sp.]